MTDRRPRRHLRDAATMCPHVFNVPGSRQMQCELAPGHDGLHSHECTRWGSEYSKRPATALLNRCPAKHGALGRICELSAGHAGMHTGEGPQGSAVWDGDAS